MDCVATGGNVKVLAKAIHSLSRIGEELYLEPTEDGLNLRAVNSSRSAFACFLMSPLFFQRYQFPPDHAFRCKIPIKSVQTVFRSLSSLERSVEKCRIEMNTEKSRLRITLHCKHGLLKTHNLSFQDCESLQAVFDKDNCANVLRAQPRLWVDTVLHFPPSLDEVCVSVSSDQVWLRNHVEDGAGDEVSGFHVIFSSVKCLQTNDTLFLLCWGFVIIVVIHLPTGFICISWLKDHLS